MPQFNVKRKKYQAETPEKEDVVVKAGHFRFYFQNYYTIISLFNDLMLGTLYVIGALVYLLKGPEIVGNICYLLGAIFLLLRPVIKIIRNIYVYKEEDYQKQVLHKDEEDQPKDQEKSRKREEKDKADDTMEVEKKEEKEYNVEKEDKKEENEEEKEKKYKVHFSNESKKTKNNE